jgi:hypothetical protein
MDEKSQLKWIRIGNNKENIKYDAWALWMHICMMGMFQVRATVGHNRHMPWQSPQCHQRPQQQLLPIPPLGYSPEFQPPTIFVHVQSAQGAFLVLLQPGVNAFSVEHVSAIEAAQLVARFEFTKANRATFALLFTKY